MNRRWSEASLGWTLALVACGSGSGTDDGSEATTSVDTSGATGMSGPDAESSAGSSVSEATDPTASTVDSSDSGGGDSSSGGMVDVPVDLPGSIEGVEPESHSHHPPMIDGNGTLYRITESPADDGNNTKMMRSTDSGATWSEADAANRPDASDLEGCWQLQVGTALYVSVASSDRVSFSIFNTSDADDRPDEWVLDETVIEELGNDGGVVQFSSLARTSDGQIWLFHSDTMIDGNQQIGYRRRSVAGDWSDGQSIGEPSGSWTGPRPVVGADDVTHVFYNDLLEHALYWRTLSAAGELSEATRIDPDGASETRIPQTTGVYYDVDGSEVVVIGYADADGIFRAITITDGVPDASDPIAPAPVLEDPDVALNDGTVGHLSLDGNTVHALWSDLATGDVLHSSRTHGGAWSAPEVAWDSGDGVAWWVYGNVYIRGGFKRLGFTYDIGEHPDDVGNIEYDELTL